jgi:hypothetical protein
MRYTALRFALVAWLVGLWISPALAQNRTQPPASQGADRPGAPGTVSMTVRVRPDDLVKAAQDLARMVRDGSMVGVPFLQELSRAISAEVAVERDVPAGDAPSLRMSSDAWARRSPAADLRKPTPSAGARLSDPAAVPSASSQSIGTTFAAVMATLAGHAAAIRSGAASLAGQLPDDKAAALAGAASQVRITATAVARSAQAAYANSRNADPVPSKR